MYPKDREEISEMLKVLYVQVVGSLKYAITSIRLDICHAVELVNKYQSSSGKNH